MAGRLDAYLLYDELEEELVAGIAGVTTA